MWLGVSARRNNVMWTYWISSWWEERATALNYSHFHAGSIEPCFYCVLFTLRYYSSILCIKIVRFLHHENVGTLCPWSGEVPANSTPEPRRCVECLPDVRCHPTPVTLCLYPVSTIYLYTVQSVGSIYSLYTGQSAGCRPIKGLMRQGSGLQDPAPAPGVYLPAHTPPTLIWLSWAGHNYLHCRLQIVGGRNWAVVSVQAGVETCAATPRN